MAFNGFPQDGLSFLDELSQSNRRDWFNANKPRFESDLQQPALAFVAEMGERLKTLVPEIQTDLRTNGSGSLMRMARDTRFSLDKTPYKTAIAGMWWQGNQKKTRSPGFGFHLESQGMRLMAGMFQFDKPQLMRYRQAVVDERLGPQLRIIVDQLASSQCYMLGGLHYKRIPAGFDPVHPNAALLLFNALYAYPMQPIPPAQVTSPELIERCLSHFQIMAPVQRWLAEVFVEDRSAGDPPGS